jgi:hypothetical protein
MKYIKAIDDFITLQFEPHKEVTHKDSIFWKKKKLIVAEITRSQNFYVPEHIFEHISKMFSLGKNETKESISIWLGKHYDFGHLNVIVEYLW